MSKMHEGDTDSHLALSFISFYCEQPGRYWIYPKGITRTIYKGMLLDYTIPKEVTKAHNKQCGCDQPVKVTVKFCT